MPSSLQDTAYAHEPATPEPGEDVAYEAFPKWTGLTSVRLWGAFTAAIAIKLAGHVSSCHPEEAA